MDDEDEAAGGSPPETPRPPEPDGPAAATSPTGHPAHHRHHWVRTPLLIVGAIVLVAVVVVVGSYVLRSRPTPKSLGSSIHQFKSTTTTAPTPKSFALPAAGVYKTTGQGSERITKPPNSETDGPVMPVSVTYLSGGCWRWHIDYNTSAWHEYDFCPHGSQLLLVAQANYQAWNFGVTSVTNLAQYTCNPPSPIALESPKAGEKFVQHCTGTNTAVPGPSVAAGTVTVVGVETLDIGGTPIRAIEMSRNQKISGAQTGVLNETWWFAASTGLPLKAVRNYQLVTSSVIGNITYNESGSWQLDSLTPQT